MYFTPKQLNLLEFIQNWQEENGLSPTLEEMACHFKVTKITIYEHLNQLEKKGAIQREKFRARSVQIKTPLPKKRRRNSLPLLGSIRAGSPLEAVETKDTLDLDQVFPLGSNCFALRVQGNSMVDDHIQDGDFVIVENRNGAANGDTVVAVLDTGEATLKRYYRERGRIRLQPANGGMAPILARKVEIRGVVVGLLRKYQG
ncbi:MAG: repressor LexA [Planctomycetes bacterium]|nr:repressor LexA [Planctomycetota bacterium]